ncbi:MAG: DUF177 domain-containing protein [Deltaproteobacteria bacterium]|nr:DUF177 domain-containing protein [Deltaproteobacteria bacterium]
MKLNVHQIEESAKQLTYEEPTEPLNARLVHGGVCDFEFPAKATVRVDYYRAGLELFFHGKIEGTVVGHCARCLEDYTFSLATNFDVVLIPKPDLREHVELTADELDLSYYSGDQVDLTPLVDEQIILALPTRPLCGENCKGLCPSCGANLNQATCNCTVSTGNPRLAVLRELKIGH